MFPSTLLPDAPDAAGHDRPGAGSRIPTGLPDDLATSDVVAQARVCAEHLGSLVGSLDPAVLHGHQAASLVETFSTLERLSSAGRTLAAKAAQRSGSWRSEGDRSAAHWMARKAGVPVGQAIASLETASRLDELSEVDSALREGKLSVFQANEVASAAAADPTAQSNLLAKAVTESVAGLRDAVRKIKAAADPDEVETYRAIHRRRYLRHWTDPDGAFRLDASLTADAGAKFLSCLDPFRNQVFKDARAAGTREPYDAYSADALVAMAESAGDSSVAITREPKARTAGNRQLALSHDSEAESVDESAAASRTNRPRPSGPRAVINVHVDHAALVRGHTEAGETCEIAGVGPVPVAVVNEMANDAFLKVLVTDGADIKAVAHAGRTIPAHLRTALENRDPTCCVPGCSTTKGLEIDHLKPFAEGGPTQLDNLCRICHHHHRQKTLGGWQLTGRPGDWSWLPPPAPP